MSSVIITFSGICTMIDKIRIPVPDDALAPNVIRGKYFRRAVLPNASQGYRWYDHAIPPHVAKLHIPKEFIETLPDEIPGLQLIEADAMTWSMHGVQLYVADAVDVLTTSPDFELLPSLTDRAHVLSLELDERVVLHGSAPAVFDLFGGGLDAYKHPDANDAIHTSFTVATAQDKVELVVTRMWDQKSARIGLKADPIAGPPHIYVTNTGADSDKDEDFFLHYLATTWAPPRDAAPPTPGDVGNIRYATERERERLNKVVDGPYGVTFGCSNSNYP